MKRMVCFLLFVLSVTFFAGCEQKEEIEKKRIDYVAKISYLEAQRDAIAACSKVGIGDLTNVDGVINECDNYIKQLEAEIKTNEFLMAL